MTRHDYANWRMASEQGRVSVLVDSRPSLLSDRCSRSGARLC